MQKDEKQHSYVKVLQKDLLGGRIDRRDFLRMATLLGVSAGAAYAMSGLTPTSAAAATPKKGGKLRIAARLADMSNPATYSWEQHNFVRQTLEQLTRSGTDNITRPQLAERWEASEDLKTWTIYLRKDVKWQNDGRPFVADDVIWNLKHVLDPAVGSATLGLLSGFLMQDYETGETDANGKKKVSQKLWAENAIEKKDDHTIVLNGKSANITIPEILFHQQLFMMDPADGGVFTPAANFTGPYQITEYQQSGRCLMQARQDYWGEGPWVDQLEWIDLGDDPNAHLAAIASDQIDAWQQIDTAALPALRMLPNVKIYEAQSANTGSVSVRVDQAPFDNPLVRRALRYAIDSTAVVQLGLGGLGYEGEHHLVSRIHPDYAPLAKVQRDVGKAKQLLAEAGYPNGIDVAIYLKSSPAWESNVVQTMAEQWKEANIRVTLNPVPATQYWDIWKKVPMGFTDWTHRPLGIMLLGLCFRTNGSWNLAGYSNPEFDRVLLEAEGKLDPVERRTSMAVLEQILLDDGPIVQPVYRTIYGAYNAKVQNFVMQPANYCYYKDVWLENA